MIIVTGGAGFIGSALVAALNRREITDILIVDELCTSDKWKNLPALQFSDYMEKQDFLDLVVENQVPEEVETIFHLGACSSTTEQDLSYLVKNNFEFTKWLALWAVESKIRFVYASSAATYGDGAQGFDDDQEALHRLRPLNPYGYSKQLFDLWARETGLLKEIVGLKYFNVFGPNEYHKGDMRSYALKGFDQIKATGKVKLFKSGDSRYDHGEYVRDFIYVKDAVEMTLFFMDNPGVAGIYNVGTGQARTWNDYVRAIFAALDSAPEIEYVEMPAAIAGQYQYYTQANMERLRHAGYAKATQRLEDSVRDYVQNYLAQRSFRSGQE
ncbi:MAG: ADP-glyceromanno-heptose 6-epimerase [Planctomycetes bacterium]|nr:ADP-glyceromanno-heptose 6-epimerase [Planctomycetota bacterium]